MSRGVNKVILVGRLGNEPDVRYTAAGLAVATISLATNFSSKDRETGEWREETEWHRVIFFDRQAEVVKQYLHKGSQIYVEGRIQTRKWQDQNTGQDRYMTEIIAREMQMLDSRSDAGYGASAGTGAYPGYAAPQPSGYAAPSPSQPQGAEQFTPPPNVAPPTPPAPPSSGTVQPSHPPAGGANTTAPPLPDKSFDEDVPF